MTFTNSRSIDSGVQHQKWRSETRETDSGRKLGRCRIVRYASTVYAFITVHRTWKIQHDVSCCYIFVISLGASHPGVTIRLDNYAGAEERLIRVLTVEPKSPAAVAGLVPEKDFILGTTHQTLDSSDSLAELLHQNIDQVVEFYVYNSDSDLVRTVVLMPTYSWGGEGLLGAEVGTGYLHRLPRHVRTTDGASVERKVRYVQHPQSQQQQNEDGNKTEETKGRNGRPEAPAKTAVLEYEPQLEMEPADEEKSPAPAVGKISTTEQQRPTKKPAPLPSPPKLPVPSSVERTVSAEDVFARPPPHGSPMKPLPPPPKMQYDSPPPRR
eukprot:scaffold2103_cov185-Amphora_coffeaeformis.AAC.17